MKLVKTKEVTDFSKMIGANLRYIRIHKGLTQTKVAQALDLTFQQMQKYEAGTNCINAWRLVQLSNFFKVSVSDILDVDYKELGIEACNSIGKSTIQGKVGAGIGAWSGKHFGGVGSVSIVKNDFTVGVMTVVNSFGSTLLPNNSAFWAWPFEQNNEFGNLKPSFDNITLDYKIPKFSEYKNSTLSVVATNAKLTCSQAKRIAIMAHAGMGRVIRPCYGPTDGDIIFVMSTGKVELENIKQSIALLGMMSADCVSRSIARAIYESNIEINI